MRVFKLLFILELIVCFGQTLVNYIASVFFVLWGLLMVRGISEVPVFDVIYGYFIFLVTSLGLWGMLNLVIQVCRGRGGNPLSRKMKFCVALWLLSLVEQSVQVASFSISEGAYDRTMTWLVILPLLATIHILYLGRQYMTGSATRAEV
ncbi:hypothetical protein [Microbulbifer sp. SAOS-129_SWC]|uniref:hypothetical protein n=1 Tax=Microbulbifer sp. SAOS-129_SWC TaxID=3145235 RepID=UPI003217C88C